MSKKNKLNFIDVFSGAGGISCGLEMAGLNCILGIDHNKHAIETFKANHQNANSFCGDITQLKNKDILELVAGHQVHAVVGGPPCQGFSTVGIGDPNDTRNALFMHFVKIVKVTGPYFVIIENVTGMLAKKNEKTLRAIFRQFEKLGYNLDVQVMSSQNYGVPEKRRRTIILGTRINERPEFPSATHDTIIARTYRPSVTVAEAFRDLECKKRGLLNHDIDMAQIKNSTDLKRLKKIPEGKGIRYEKDEKAYLPPSLRLGVDWKNIREGRFRQTKYQRLDGSAPAPTIMTHRHSYFHPTENRYLTQREAAKIQSFPNDFEFKGPVSAQWRQIGNAVPPLLAKALGKSLLKMHKEALSKDSLGQKMKADRKKIHSIRKTAFVY